LEASHPGVVRLERILDKNEMDVRLYRREAIVVQCPRASFLSPSSRKPDRCVGEAENLGLVVQGLAPLKLDYERQSRGVKKSVSIPGITQTGFTSPLLLQHQQSGGGGDPSQQLALARTDDYSWAASQRIELPVNISLNAPGTETFQLESVTDGCGNRVDFGALRDAGAPMPDRILDSRSVVVHPRSQVSFVDCDPSEPVPLLRGKGAALKIRVKAGDDPVWDAAVQYTPASEAKGRTAADLRHYSLSDKLTTITVKDPGTYEIVEMTGKVCPGDVQAPSTVSGRPADSWCGLILA
jgi:nucleoporin POM152